MQVTIVDMFGTPIKGAMQIIVGDAMISVSTVMARGAGRFDIMVFDRYSQAPIFEEVRFNTIDQAIKVVSEQYTSSSRDFSTIDKALDEAKG